MLFIAHNNRREQQFTRLLSVTLHVERTHRAGVEQFWQQNLQALLQLIRTGGFVFRQKIMGFFSQIIAIKRAMSVCQITRENGNNFNIITLVDEIRHLVEDERFRRNGETHSEKGYFHQISLSSECLR